MRYVVRNDFFGLEFQRGAQEQQVPNEKQAERVRVTPFHRDKLESGDSSDIPRDSNREETVARDEDCHTEPQDNQLCAEMSGEPVYPQSGGDEHIDNEGHITQGMNIYDDEIWEGPGAAI